MVKNTECALERHVERRHLPPVVLGIEGHTLNANRADDIADSYLGTRVVPDRHAVTDGQIQNEGLTVDGCKIVKNTIRKALEPPVKGTAIAQWDGQYEIFIRSSECLVINSWPLHSAIRPRRNRKRVHQPHTDAPNTDWNPT
jgi:hypothetical protein